MSFLFVSLKNDIMIVSSAQVLVEASGVWCGAGGMGLGQWVGRTPLPPPSSLLQPHSPRLLAPTLAGELYRPIADAGKCFKETPVAAGGAKKNNHQD